MDGWLPSLRRGEAGLHHAEGLLHWTKEEGSDFEEESAYPNQEESNGEDQPQVYRHQLQVWSWKIPDSSGQGCLHGTSQEGQKRVEYRVHIILHEIFSRLLLES